MTATHLSIRAERDGFRRAGRPWARRPTVVPRSELTDEQIGQLEADPAVDVLPCGPAGAADAPAAAPAARGPLDVGEARRELLLAGMRALEPGRDDHWTAAGAPEIAALRKVTGLASIPGAERDEVWAAARAAGAGGEAAREPRR